MSTANKMPKPSPFAMGLGKSPKYLNPVRCVPRWKILSFRVCDVEE